MSPTIPLAVVNLPPEPRFSRDASATTRNGEASHHAQQFHPPTALRFRDLKAVLRAEKCSGSLPFPLGQRSEGRLSVRRWNLTAFTTPPPPFPTDRNNRLVTSRALSLGGATFRLQLNCWPAVNATLAREKRLVEVRLLCQRREGVPSLRVDYTLTFTNTDREQRGRDLKRDCQAVFGEERRGKKGAWDSNFVLAEAGFLLFHS
jgi:hypothetical protein